jgi:FkbM family methyltransferase
MIDLISDSLSYMTRKLAFIPGMFFVTKPFHKVFTKYYSKLGDKAGWRIISLNGYKMKVNVTHRMASYIYWRGAHEWAPLMLLQKELKKGMVVYDIGGNIGEMALFCAHKVGNEGKVYSFEPLDETYEVLRENIALNKYDNRLKAFNVALSDKTGEADLFAASEQNDLGSFEDGSHTLYATKDRGTFLQTIRMDTLDNKQKELLPPDFMKIDVEGAELFVLKGGAETIKKYHPKLLLEFNADTFKAAGYTQTEVLDFVKQFDYKFFAIENRGRLSELNTTALPEFVNLLCV